MHNAHVIQMKIHCTYRPMNILKLFLLGTAIAIAYNKQDRQPILRKLSAAIEHEWLT